MLKLVYLLLSGSIWSSEEAGRQKVNIQINNQLQIVKGAVKRQIGMVTLDGLIKAGFRSRIK